jgi:hypothetical protein
MSTQQETAGNEEGGWEEVKNQRSTNTKGARGGARGAFSVRGSKAPRTTNSPQNAAANNVASAPPASAPTQPAAGPPPQPAAPVGRDPNSWSAKVSAKSTPTPEPVPTRTTQQKSVVSAPSPASASASASASAAPATESATARPVSGRQRGKPGQTSKGPPLVVNSTTGAPSEETSDSQQGGAFRSNQSNRGRGGRGGASPSAGRGQRPNVAAEPAPREQRGVPTPWGPAGSSSKSFASVVGANSAISKRTDKASAAPAPVPAPAPVSAPAPSLSDFANAAQSVPARQEDPVEPSANITPATPATQTEVVAVADGNAGALPTDSIPLPAFVFNQPQISLTDNLVPDASFTFPNSLTQDQSPAPTAAVPEPPAPTIQISAPSPEPLATSAPTSVASAPAPAEEANAQDVALQTDNSSEWENMGQPVATPAVEKPQPSQPQLSQAQATASSTSTQRGNPAPKKSNSGPGKKPNTQSPQSSQPGPSPPQPQPQGPPVPIPMVPSGPYAPSYYPPHGAPYYPPYAPPYPHPHYAPFPHPYPPHYPAPYYRGEYAPQREYSHQDFPQQNQYDRGFYEPSAQTLAKPLDGGQKKLGVDKTVKAQSRAHYPPAGRFDQPQPTYQQNEPYGGGYYPGPPMYMHPPPQYPDHGGYNYGGQPYMAPSAN